MRFGDFSHDPVQMASGKILCPKVSPQKMKVGSGLNAAVTRCGARTETSDSAELCETSVCPIARYSSRRSYETSMAGQLPIIPEWEPSRILREESLAGHN
jgi:hypothetical protein